MPGILCEHCTAACCRYIALPLDTPGKKRDFDDIRWFLMHENVSVFVEDGDWYISFVTNCRHLQPDNRCGVYHTRPQICRDYSTSNCDYHSGDYGWQHHFTCPEHLDEFLRQNPPRESPRRGRKMRGRLRARALARKRPRGGRVDYAAATADIRGVPLPVLRFESNGHAGRA